jgi:hypothetical protein
MTLITKKNTHLWTEDKNFVQETDWLEENFFRDFRKEAFFEEKFFLEKKSSLQSPQLFSPQKIQKKNVKLTKSISPRKRAFFLVRQQLGIAQC